MAALWLLAGLVLLVVTAADAVDTLISTRIRPPGRWPTDVFYRVTWPPFRAMARRLGPQALRESVLSLYGPMSFVGLLFMWTLSQILGWALIWQGLGTHFAAPDPGMVDSIYYSGVVFFSVGFGDILPATGLLRLLTLAEAFIGLSTMGLAIGYLPSLYSAYQAREKQLLLLDDLSETRITPISLIVSVAGADGDVARVERFFDDWASWVAEVFESHSSFPMLMFFRSKYPGQSWITGLGVVTDAAIGVISAVPGQEDGAAMRLYRQSVRAFSVLADRADLDPGTPVLLSPEMYSRGYRRLQSAFEDLAPEELALARINELRREVHPFMEAMIDGFDAPRGFWGVTSAVHMATDDPI